MLTATLRNVGGSVMVAIPKTLLEGLGLAANTKVGLSLDHGRLIVEPQSKPHYILKDLLSQCDLSTSICPEEKIWDDLSPMGREVW